MKIWRIIKIAVLFVAGACFIYSGFRIVRYISDGNKQNQLNSSIKQMVKLDEPESALSYELPENTVSEKLTVYEEEYNKLQEVCSDAIGWITISNTNVDYPILQASDNEFYLNHDINKDESIRGSIFLDWKNHIDDQHIVVYGHNMKDGSMFGDLKNYRKEEFYRVNSVIEINLGGENTWWEIFSVRYTDATPYCTAFADSDDFYTYVSRFKTQSLYDTGTEIEKTDRVLTLSTCSKVFNNARFVVHAVEIEKPNG